MKLYFGNTTTTVTTILILGLMAFVGYSVWQRADIQFWGRRSLFLVFYGLLICCFAAARDGLDKTIQCAIDGSRNQPDENTQGKTFGKLEDAVSIRIGRGGQNAYAIKRDDEIAVADIIYLFSKGQLRLYFKDVTGANITATPVGYAVETAAVSEEIPAALCG